MIEGNLPPGWATATLPELVGNHGLFVDGDWVESKDQDPDGDVRLVQLADVGDGEYLNKSHRFMTSERAVALSCTFLREGDLLIARMPDPLGRACLFPGDAKRAVTVVDICVVRGAQANFSRRWLMHFVNAPAFRVAVHGLQSGSTRKRISKGNLATLSMPIPPKSEQSRIADRLDEALTELNVGVAELLAAQKKLAQYRQSLLKAAVEGALTQEWRAKHPPKETGAALLARILKERRARWEARQLDKFKAQGKVPPKGWQDKYPEPDKPDVIDLPALPDQWVWASLDQLAEIQGGLQKQPSRAPISNKFPFLRVANVARGLLKLDEVHEIELLDGELERVGLLEDDLLIVEGNGSKSEIGRCARWDGSIANAVHQNHLIRARPVLMRGGFVETWINSHTGIRKLTDLAATTSGLYTLSVSKISKIPVPVAALDEQDQIGRELATQIGELGRMNEAVERGLKQAATQRQNILRAAFSGQLVPQDPRDEPAAALLARIRAERAAPGAKPRKPRAAKEST